MSTTPAIRTDGLTKAFHRKPVLRDLDLEVPTGCVFGYLGPNGAGKSTTIRLLTSLLRPTSGTASVLGFDTVREARGVRGAIGYLPGDFAGYAAMTGRQYLGCLAGLRAGVDPALVTQLAERFAIDLHKRIGTLSHGNRQKIGIIQAFMHRPELLVLDEPTTGLDPIMQTEFLALLRETRAGGRTVFLSSHVLSEVEAVADVVGIVNEGRLLVTKPLAELEASAVRRLDLRFEVVIPVEALRSAAGVTHVDVDHLTARVTLSGDTADLLRIAAPYGVVDLRTHERDLADVFLGYYDRGAGPEADHPKEATSHADQHPDQSAVGPQEEPAGLG